MALKLYYYNVKKEENKFFFLFFYINYVIIKVVIAMEKIKNFKIFDGLRNLARKHSKLKIKLGTLLLASTVAVTSLTSCGAPSKNVDSNSYNNQNNQTVDYKYEYGRNTKTNS